mgnify:CR=1 FL=1
MPEVLRHEADHRSHSRLDDFVAAIAPVGAGPDFQLAAIAGLPERQRAALVLQYYDGLSNIEAAAAMEIGVEALESLLSRARRNLKAQLRGNDHG